MLKGVFAATLLVLSTSLVSGFVTTPGLDFTHCPREGVLRHGSRVLSPRMEAPKLGQVRLPACKKLCPGCEPWICPLAPQGEDANEPHSESAARLLELREEQELNRDKERLEALAAGVIGVESLEQWEKLIAENNADGHVSVVFWGGSWCRKCMALKPKYVKLAGEMTEEATEGTLRFYYADARGVAQKVGTSRATPPPRILPDELHPSPSRADRPRVAAQSGEPPSVFLKKLAGVGTVPTLQAYAGGELASEYVAGQKVNTVIPKAREMILAVLAQRA